MEAVGQLIGGIAHDFNNLLAIIQGNLEFLGERIPDDSDMREMTAAALGAAERGALLTHRLLAYSRRQPLTPRVVDLAKLIDGLMVVLQRTLEESIRIETVIGADLSLVRIDPNQLESAIINLAVNGRDAMPGGGTLTIRAENVLYDRSRQSGRAIVLPGRYVRLSVADTGTGMTEEVAGRAHEPFFTTKGVAAGTGLGLSMVYGFVEQSGGHLAIESKLESGTTVSLLLPEAAEAAVARLPSVASRQPTAERVVLVVEDDAAVRQLLLRSLGALSYRTLDAADGPAALAILDRHPEIGILLTDIVLPKGMSGVSLADAARAQRPELKVLFMSGYVAGNLAHVADAGTVEILTKPFTRDRLAAALGRQFAEGTGR
jgi:CheY-like chemotaxis protein